MEEYNQNEYIRELDNENKSLKDKIKVIEQDRDETKRDLQDILVKYLELYAKKNKINKEDLFEELGKIMKTITDK